MKSIIQDTLPNFPDDIIDQWILPFVDTDGWPPTDEQGKLRNGWRFILGKDMAYWRSIKWELKESELLSEHLGRMSKSQINDIFQVAVLGASNHMSQIYDLKARFDQVVTYISVNGTYPRPPILVVMDAQYEIMDGNHRVSAYFYCVGAFAKAPNLEVVQKTKRHQRMWIGTPLNSSIA